MTRLLAKGANAIVEGDTLDMVVRWGGAVDVDIAALLCAPGGKVRSDDDFVFYNQPRHPASDVSHTSKSRGQVSTDGLQICLGGVEPTVDRIVVTASADGGNFGGLTSLSIELLDSATKASQLRFDITDATVETAMILGELYRRDGRWKFRAVGQGYATGLQGVAEDFGINVDDSAPSETADRVDTALTSTIKPAAAHQRPYPAQPINYTRTSPPNSPTDIRAPSPQAPPEAPRIARQPLANAASASPSSPQDSTLRATRPASPPQARAALQTSAAELKPLVAQWQRIADHVGSTAAQMLRDFADAHDPNLGTFLANLRGARDAVTNAFQMKFGQAPSAGYGGSPANPSIWVSQANALVERLNRETAPWTDKKRSAWTAEFRQLTSELLAQYDPTVRQVAVDAWQQMRHKGSAQSATTKQVSTRNAPALTEPAPPAGPRTVPLDPQHPVPTGPGPLNFYLGHLVADWLRFSSTSHSDFQSGDDQVRLPSLRVPIVLDLDVIGAFVVDEPRCLEGAVLNLLSSLPANQLQLKIFDPEHGGNSAKFLFGLGDYADRVIGDRVKTSDRELDELLQSTEEHITFVTQRFLQGEHKSLTEYNEAAGEVAEPYQLLLLYDFPSGFSRGGHPDKDLLDRLTKIVRNGPRTGVFTIISSPTSSRLLSVTSAELAPALRQIPWFISGVLSYDQTFAAIAKGINGIRVPQSAPSPPHRSATAKIGPGALSWTFEPASPPTDGVVSSQLDAVKRAMHSARDVQVTPYRIAQLAEQAQRAEAVTLGRPAASTVANPDRPETWWRASSQTGVVAHFGRIGARQVADLIIDSEVNTYSALIGGRPGSGKSVLIHAIIMSIATEYSPGEVELFLIDFKEGVEFKQYADIGLPHARVIAIESERDFGLSVLQRAAAEIKRRGELFRGAGQGAANLEQFRARTHQPLKRLVLIIDEFQQLFYRDDKIAAESAEILELILRQGRAFGIHVLLASQSLAGMASLGKHVLGLIPTRVALQSNESDSRMILGDENADAQLLTRAGEGILNRKGGHKDANERFQAAFWDADHRSSVLEHVAHRAAREGHPQITTIFDGHKPADIATLNVESLLTPPIESAFSGASIPVGLPMTLDPIPHFARLGRESGSNLLIVDEHAAGVLAVAIASVCYQSNSVDVLDFVGEDNHWSTLRQQLEILPGSVFHGRRLMRSALSDLAAEVQRRHSTADHSAPARVLVIAAMGRGRDFDPNDSYDEESPSHMLGEILRDGPEVGIFTVAWFDRPAGIRKRLDNAQLNEFGRRLVTSVSRDESSQLLDSDTAAALKHGQGVLADVDRGTESKLRTFDSPTPEWFSNVRQEMKARTGAPHG